jgi:putative ABC transport system permease protein
MRTVAVRWRHGHRSRQIGVMGLGELPELQRVIDAELRSHRLPADGLVLSRKLGEIMEIRRGDRVNLEVLEGGRPTREVVVADLVDDFMGLSAYMEIDALRRLMREGGTLSGAFLLIDPSLLDEFYRRVKSIPAVAGVGLTWAALQGFRDTMAQNLNIMIFFNVLFAGIIAFGVVYNAARISLSERSRELASLRVMGFTRAEISFILLGELAVLTFLAIPIGLLLGYGMAALVVEAYDIELYRFPLVVTARTYAASALTVAVAAVFSGLVVRRKLDRLDLVAVLKTRE